MADCKWPVALRSRSESKNCGRRKRASGPPGGCARSFRCIGTDELVPDAQPSSSCFKQRGKIPPAGGKAVAELKPVVCLNTLYPNTSASVPSDQFVQEVGGGVGGLFRVGSQKAQTDKLVNNGEQSKLRGRHASVWHHLHVHLDPLTEIGHLLIRFGLVGFFLLSHRKQP